jgi:hypothetical protein
MQRKQRKKSNFNIYNIGNEDQIGVAEFKFGLFFCLQVTNAVV